LLINIKIKRFKRYLVLPKIKNYFPFNINPYTKYIFLKEMIDLKTINSILSSILYKNSLGVIKK
ncbi:MAG: hypothetical protein JSW62_00135, partial [Thermoplasmatales archaeon]